jgi:hypothetical protein
MMIFLSSGNVRRDEIRDQGSTHLIHFTFHASRFAPPLRVLDQSGDFGGGEDRPGAGGVNDRVVVDR